VGRLDVKVADLKDLYERLSAEIRENRMANDATFRSFSEQLASFNGRLSRLEGRTDSMKAELTVALQLEILKMAQGFQPIPGSGRAALPAPEDSP